MPALPPPPRQAARLAFAARGVLLRAADRMLPSDALAWVHTSAFMRTRLLAAAARLEVFDALHGGPATAPQLAERLGVDADHLHRVLRALAVDDVVHLDRDGRFRNGRLGDVLRAGHPRSMRDWLLYLDLDSTQSAWAGLTEAVRTGDPAFPAVHGRSVWDHFAANPLEEALFARTMRRLTQLDLPSIAGAATWPQRGTVCDVAGGAGTLLAGVLQAHPQLRGILVEAPGVLKEADAHLRAEGVRDRVDLVAGSIFDHVEATADVYVLKDILHDWDDERSARILQVVRGPMQPASRLVLIEVLQDTHVPDMPASMIDVHMLTQCDGGRQRSLAELHGLLRGAGLEPGPVTRLAVPALVEGLAP